MRQKRFGKDADHAIYGLNEINLPEDEEEHSSKPGKVNGSTGEPDV